MSSYRTMTIEGAKFTLIVKPVSMEGNVDSSAGKAAMDTITIAMDATLETRIRATFSNAVDSERTMRSVIFISSFTGVNSVSKISRNGSNPVPNILPP